MCRIRQIGSGTVSNLNSKNRVAIFSDKHGLVEAGIADHFWTMAEIVALIEL
jgi:hypothetical protein